MLSNSFSVKSPLKRYDDKVMERFIPSNASQHIYKSIHLDIQPQDVQAAQHLGFQYIRDTSIFNLNETSINEGSLSLVPNGDHTSSSSHGLPSSTPGYNLQHKDNSLFQTPNRGRDAIADALSFAPQSRVLSFSATSNKKKRLVQVLNGDSMSSSPSSIFSSSSHHFGNDSNYTSRRNSFESEVSNLSSLSSLGSSTFVTLRKRKIIKSHIPYRVLDAPSLRNDFYTNLISWSSVSNKIAVGLSSHVYIWSEEDGANLLDIPDEQIISCVSFSENDFIAVASKKGRISIFSQKNQLLLDEYSNIGKQGICCISWVPNDPNKFYAGDESGDVLYFEVNDRNGQLNLIKQFKCHQQQVCGISVSYDGKQISVGGNDNCCTIWDVQDPYNPIMKFLLPHQAAVKAITYCPWSNSLLATGGGSKDRAIRFWHTNSGTLLDSFQTKGQITSLIWSKRKKQIVVTFGFGDCQKPLLIGLYTYPRMDAIVQVEATPNLRILSAVLSPDSSSICVAANDETVRFYELWNPKDSIIVESQESGIYGSSLIELSEGITKSDGFIR